MLQWNVRDFFIARSKCFIISRKEEKIILFLLIKKRKLFALSATLSWGVWDAKSRSKHFT